MDDVLRDRDRRVPVPDRHGDRHHVAWSRAAARDARVHYAMSVCRLAEWSGQTIAITPRGQQRAEWLLRELYDNPTLTEIGDMRADIEP